jgi:hypothetical protein
MVIRMQGRGDHQHHAAFNEQAMPTHASKVVNCA